MENNKKNKAFQFGVYVFIILAVLTVGEYALAIVGAPLVVGIYRHRSDQSLVCLAALYALTAFVCRGGQP